MTTSARQRIAAELARTIAVDHDPDVLASIAIATTVAYFVAGHVQGECAMPATSCFASIVGSALREFAPIMDAEASKFVAEQIAKNGSAPELKVVLQTLLENHARRLLMNACMHEMTEKLVLKMGDA